jgi:hypothetical protein
MGNKGPSHSNGAIVDNPSFASDDSSLPTNLLPDWAKTEDLPVVHVREEPLKAECFPDVFGKFLKTKEDVPRNYWMEDLLDYSGEAAEVPGDCSEDSV